MIQKPKVSQSPQAKGGLCGPVCEDNKGGKRRSPATLAPGKCWKNRSRLREVSSGWLSGTLTGDGKGS